MKKILSVFLLLAVLCGLFAGCKAKKVANSTTDIEIVYWEAGYGREYLDAVINEFNERQDTYNAILVSSAEIRNDEIHLNADENSADLYISSWVGFNGYLQYLEPLDELLQRKPDGENGKTIAEKIGAGFLDHNKSLDGHTYSLNGTPGSLTALMYNKNLFVDADGNPLELPNTTNELIDLTIDLKSDGKIPWIQYRDYWYYIYEAWVAQYEGIDVYTKIWQGIYTDENGVEHENDVRIVTESDGRLEAYRVVAELINPKGYVYTGSNNFTHTQAQTYFLNDKAVFMPNGTFMENEMKASSGTDHIGIMKQPVISALAKKLGIKGDRHLSLIVDYVDGDTLSAADQAIVDSYSEDVIQRVREARNFYYGCAPYNVMVPSYSNCKDGAFAFLEFYYSDEGMQIAQEVLKTPLSLKYSVDPELDKSTWSTYMQEVDAIYENANNFYHYLVKPLFYMNTMDHLHSVHPIEYMTYRNDGNTLSATEYWKKEVAAWETKWESVLMAAGLS